MRRIRVVAALLALGCAGGGGQEAASTASWEGATPGALRGTATAIRCEEGRDVLLMLAAGDSGVALLLRPDSTGLAGEYPVSVRADTAPRPRATAGFRRYADRTVRGYGALDGRATVILAGQRIEARLEATLIDAEYDDTVRLRARLQALLPDSAEACAGEPAAP